MLTVTLNLHIQSEANLREHWRQKASRAKLHRTTAWAELRLAGQHLPRLIGPVTVTLTRIAPRKLDDDNLASGFKATRDGVADWLGIDDGSELIAWRYAQERGKPNEYAARVEVMG